MNQKYSHLQVVILGDDELARILIQHLGDLGLKGKSISHFKTGTEAEDRLREVVIHLLFIGSSLPDVDPVEFAEMIFEDEMGHVRIAFVYDETSPFVDRGHPFCFVPLRRSDLSQETILAALRCFYP